MCHFDDHDNSNYGLIHTHVEKLRPILGDYYIMPRKEEWMYSITHIVLLDRFVHNNY